MALRHGNRICARVRRRLIYPREVRCGKLRLHRRLAIPRPDIKFNMELVESCSSEIINDNKPNIIIGCIYRHPTANMSDFTLELEGIVKKLMKKIKQFTCIMGDINIDFLKYGNHPITQKII